MLYLSSGRVPIKMWLNEIEDGALDQVRNLAQLPFAFKHIAIMPDAHQGFGMPIGGVLATKDVVIPNAVGVDIGCGMSAVKTSLTNLDETDLKKIMGIVRKRIPVGFNKHDKLQDINLMPPLLGINKAPLVNGEYYASLRSLGTLGGGNHFIEFQKNEFDGSIWVMVHSGSRNLGKKIADYYNNLAINLNQKWHSIVPREWQLAFLPVDSKEGQTYIDEMDYAIKFARANRKVMMDRIIEVIKDVLHAHIQVDEPINIAHNYVKLEHHFGEDVWVHRKGATSAKNGEIGIIPGSQGTYSYIVKGKGNPESFQSCSHGSGRILSRTKAQSSLDLATEIKKLDDQGIVHGIRTTKDLDEAAGAYKDIQSVMDNQEDLVEILVQLTPIGSIKG